MYRGMVDNRIDLATSPRPGELDELERALSGLGLVPTWLRWIHGFLSWRWRVHPLCPRSLNPIDIESDALGRGWASGWARHFADVAVESEATTCSVH